MASDLPAHTRGFLFADLRGYSAFTELHGDQAARELLASYRQSVRGVIGTFDGAEIRTEGDSFYVVFDSVSQAVRAGLAILAAVDEPSAEAAAHPVLVGIGIHAGEAEDSAEGIVSSAVNVAARICAQAEPGELLVSDTVRALTRSYLEVSFLPRGRRRLKGIAEPVALYGVVAGRTAGNAVRRNPVRSALPSGDLGRVALAVAAAAGVLAIAIIGGTLMREGVAHEEPTPSASGPAATGLASPSGSDAAPSASLAPFPTDAELALLEAVDESSQDRCSRPTEGPTYIAVNFTNESEPIKVAFVAGIDCALGGINAPDRLRIWQLYATATSRSSVDLRVAPSAILRQKADANAAPRTACAQQVPALEEWSFGDNSGLLTCYETTTGDAILWWTYDGTDIVATAVRDDSDMASLLAWWTAEARFAP